jgi:hypothetical protein
VLELARSAAKMHQWRILCFDQAFLSLTLQWTERDERMARNFLTQRTELCPSGKVVAICGGGHARLRANTYPKFFPSFARQLQLLDPNLRVGAVSINFVAGAFFNMGVRRLLDPRPLPPQLNDTQLTPSDEFSYALRLPIATPSTFLAPANALESAKRSIFWKGLEFLANAITKLRTRQRSRSS